MANLVEVGNVLRRVQAEFIADFTQTVCDLEHEALDLDNLPEKEHNETCQELLLSCAELAYRLREISNRPQWLTMTQYDIFSNTMGGTWDEAKTIFLAATLNFDNKKNRRAKIKIVMAATKNLQAYRYQLL